MTGKTPVLAAAAVLALLSIGVPVRLPASSSGASIADCLTIADAPSAAHPAIETTLERCATLLPKDPELVADLARAYEAGRHDQLAEAAYQRALEIDPDYADLRLHLGRLLLRRGAAREARQQAERALQTHPNRTALRELLSEAANAEGRR